jgi:hypothetical protein
LSIELGGLAADSEHDQLIVAGTATLGGTLNLDLVGEFAPSLGNHFTILTADSRSGMFNSIVGDPGLGLSYDVQYSSNQVVVAS